MLSKKRARRRLATVVGYRIMKIVIKVLTTATLMSSHGSDAVTYLFAHGIADNHKQAYKYAKSTTDKKKTTLNKNYLVDNTVITFDFPDAQGWLAKLFRVNFTQTSLGQDNELKALAQAYDKAIALADPEGIVLVGLSRGASALASFIALNNPTKIKAVVLESPFDSFVASINDKITRPWVRRFVHALVRRGWPFFKHRIDAATPVDLVAKIPLDMPVLVVCSMQDTTVSAASSIRLYKKLRETGHNHAHLLILDHGRHAQLLQAQQGHIYHNVTHAFYKKYSLAHDPVSAERGKAILERCQPDITKLP
jgi:pimeloyl-ACP methyl ester carboxylesterase